MDHLTRLRLFLLATATMLGCGGADGTDCEVGTEHCACTVSTTCVDGLVCAENVCVSPRTTTLPEIDAAARSCEVLLEDGAARVVGADFASAVRGQVIRQAPRTAVTFHSAADAPIPRAAIAIELLGDGEMRVAFARCFDREGRPIPGGGLASGS